MLERIARGRFGFDQNDVGLDFLDAFDEFDEFERRRQHCGDLMAGRDQAAADFDRALLRFIDNEYSCHGGRAAMIRPIEACLHTATPAKLPERTGRIADRRNRKVAKITEV